ncbi:MAG: hypothetical protein EP330_09705 [Deltaproteobacteria bacterium]|nr:MAG: hypothetical protein EP330_09705 [Deltaproteobacteria bacterium]
MRTWPLLAALLLAPTAEAFTLDRHGIWLQGAGGFAVDNRGIGPAWQLGGGYWWGNYDRDYALGRYWGLGLTARQDYIRGELSTVPLVELRRGNDLIVAGLHWFLSAGPVIRPEAIGVEGRLGGGGRFRVNPSNSLFIRLEAGGGYVDGLHVGGGLVVGMLWSRPTDGVQHSQ